MITVNLAKKAMKVFERQPDISGTDRFLLKEIFDHKIFIDGSEEERKTIMLKSAESKYLNELAYPWDHYFGFDLKPLLEGKSFLDLGCFNGGRSIAWYEKYNSAAITGIDVEDEYIDAATLFANARGINATFKKSVGESLPFDDDTFDAVLSYDVLEHVQDVVATLSECRRVLKKGGRLFVVFPSYYQPMEHHLVLVSITPGLQYLFSGKTLVKAYCEILDERGDEANWYKRMSADLHPWEKGHTINGTTFGGFKKIAKSQGWAIHSEVHKPLGSIGRTVEGKWSAKALSKVLFPLTYIPGIREVCLHRSTFILEKS
jgi:2-polyprenyl-3-methyl-5-hydroxy-6-metoxy-1,4-benzoquinol methylase